MSLQIVNCTCKKHRGFTFQIDAPLRTPTPRSTLACSRGRIRFQMGSWRQLWAISGAPKGHFWGAQSHLHWHWHWQGIGLCIWPTMVSVVSFDKAAYLIYQSVSKRFAVNPPQWDGIDGMALDFWCWPPLHSCWSNICLSHRQRTERQEWLGRRMGCQ